MRFEEPFKVDNPFTDRFQSLKMRNHLNVARKYSFQLMDYELYETIGEGGFGKVKKAVHKMTQQTVAIKIFRIDSQNRKQIDLIDKEIQIHKNLMHSHIARVFEVIRTECKVYLVMEYCSKGDLLSIINKNGPISEKEASRIFHQILSALTYLKDNNIAHRDIKPQNILFDEHMNAKVIDFGFSCQVEDESQFQRTVCGTPSYTAPEMLMNKPYFSELTDVWSLGVTLYAMLAAQLPFDAESQEKRRERICKIKYKIPSTFTKRSTKMLSRMLVEPSQRATFKQIQESEFCQPFGAIQQPSCINFMTERLVINKSALAEVQRKCSISSRDVIDAVKAKKLNRQYATYFLMIKSHNTNTVENGEGQIISEFNKQSRKSVCRLEPLSRTPIIRKSKVADLFNLKGITNVRDQRELKLVRMKYPINPRRIDSSRGKIPRNNTIDSPRRVPRSKDYK